MVSADRTISTIHSSCCIPPKLKGKPSYLLSAVAIMAVLDKVLGFVFLSVLIMWLMTDQHEHLSVVFLSEPT